MSERSCLDCGASPAGDWCQNCGQRASVRRLQPNELVGDLLGNLFNLDRGIWPTFLGLLQRPGEVAAGYAEGKRRRFVNPLKYFIFALALHFLAMAAFDLRLSDLTDARIRVTDAQQQRMEEASATVVQLFDEHQRFLLMAGVPVYAWGLGLAFRRRDKNFAEICVLLLYAFAQGTLLIRLPLHLATGFGLLEGVGLARALQLLYLGWAAKQFFGTSWWRAQLAVFAAYFAWLAAVLVLVIGSVGAALALS